MSPSKKSARLGVRLVEVSTQTGVSVQTLINWYKNKPELFETVCVGAAKLIKEKEDNK